MRYLISAFVLLIPAIVAAEPFNSPIVRIDAGMHSSAIEKISCDATGRLILTCSSDCSAKLWDVSNGRLIRTWRPFIGKERCGQLYACALSPDGKIAAVGGNSSEEKIEGPHQRIYLFDTATGQLIMCFDGMKNVIRDLKFCSFKGAGGQERLFLAALLDGFWGLRVWNVESGQLVAVDEDSYIATRNESLDCTSSNGIFWVATTSRDGLVRLYNLNKAAGQSLRKADVEKFYFNIQPALSFSIPGLQFPSCVRFSPSGKRLAVGFDESSITIHDTASLMQLNTLHPVTGDDGHLSAVAWLSNTSGTQLIAGGGTFERNGQFPIEVWSSSTRNNNNESIHSISIGAANTITDIKATPDGGVIFSTADPMWGCISREQVLQHSKSDPTKPGLQLLQRSALCDFRDYDGSVRLSPDGFSVEVLFEKDSDMRSVMNVGQRSLEIGAESMDGLLRTTRTDGCLVSGHKWKDRAADFDNPPWWRGEPSFNITETARSLVVAPDESYFVFGTSGYLRCYNKDGSFRWRQPALNSAWGINTSSNGLLVVAAMGDGTIRWHRADNGRELLALFPHTDRRRWVLWTPEGYYDCSPGGESLIGWHINRDKEQPADFFPASRYRNVFYRPDVIAKVLNTLDTVQAVREADLVLRESDSEHQYTETDPQKLAAVIKSLSPPVVEELHAKVGPESRPTVFGEVVLKPTDTAITIRYRVRQTGDKPPVKATIRFNGRLVNGNAPLPLPGEWAMVEVPLPKAMSGELSVFAELENRLSVSEPAVLRIEREPGGIQPRKPRLYLVSVGVTKAPQSGFPNLTMAAEDARRIGKALSAQRGKLYELDEVADTTRTFLLPDEEATTEAVCAALRKVASAAEPEDVMVFFFAGHGAIDAKQGYYLVTHDTKEKHPALTGKKLSELLEPIKARTVMVLETCFAGGAFGGMGLNLVVNSPKDLTGLTNQLASAEEGTVVITSSGVQEVSREDKRNGGLLTQAILECVQGGTPSAKSNAFDDSPVTCVMLQESVIRRVPELLDEAMKNYLPNSLNDRGVFRQPTKQEMTQQHPTCVMPKGVPDFVIARP